MSFKRILLSLAVVLALLAAGIYLIGSQPATDSPRQNQTAKDNGFDKSRYSIDEPGSLWWIVNKQRPLPDDYVPPDLAVPDVRLRLDANEEQMKLESRTTKAVEIMFASAQADDIVLELSSGYRSEDLQRQFYNDYVARDGRAAADRYSARPGTSEHQTGLAVDVIATTGQCDLEICFADTHEGKWLAANAYRYGFIVRYPSDKEAITGYQYEPWHLRYIGADLAAELNRRGITMEEFFGL